MPGATDVHGRTSVAGGKEKVRPGTGREAGLGHAGSDLKKILCGNKDQARSCRSGEKCGLDATPRSAIFRGFNL
jgi:hypothetical protein